jgi:hypothetical protein
MVIEGITSLTASLRVRSRNSCVTPNRRCYFVNSSPVFSWGALTGVRP